MRTVVGVLRGGPSSEYEVSLKTGASVLGALDAEKYEPRDLFVDRSGQWHLHGMPVLPERALAGVDVCFSALHGEWGEDGGLHSILDPLGVPYTGARALASAFAFNKHKTREVVSRLGIKVPYGVMVEPEEDYDRTALRLFRTMPHPVVIKPLVGGSSVGISIAGSYHELVAGLERAATTSPRVLVEEFIRGREATVGIIDNFRNEQTYALVPVPNDFFPATKDELVGISKQIHRELGLTHYSHSDFIVSKRGIYFLEVNTLPKLYDGSVFRQGLEFVGAKLSHFLDHVLSLARGKIKALP